MRKPERRASIRQLRSLIARVAPQQASVLIPGESGAGKELVARALGKGSPRANRPFVAINCAALSETLLESELFGHERGAFTGAVAQKKGKLEMAEGGSVSWTKSGKWRRDFRRSCSAFCRNAPLSASGPTILRLWTSG